MSTEEQTEARRPTPELLITDEMRADAREALRLCTLYAFANKYLGGAEPVQSEYVALRARVQAIAASEPEPAADPDPMPEQPEGVTVPYASHDAVTVKGNAADATDAAKIAANNIDKDSTMEAHSTVYATDAQRASARAVLEARYRVDAFNRLRWLEPSYAAALDHPWVSVAYTQWLRTARGSALEQLADAALLRAFAGVANWPNTVPICSVGDRARIYTLGAIYTITARRVQQKTWYYAHENAGNTHWWPESELTLVERAPKPAATSADVPAALHPRLQRSGADLRLDGVLLVRLCDDGDVWFLDRKHTVAGLQRLLSDIADACAKHTADCKRRSAAEHKLAEARAAVVAAEAELAALQGTGGDK